jgi:hypothetical protein
MAVTVLASASAVPEAFAEARQIRTVDDRPPGTLRLSLAHVQLDRVRPDVDDGVPRRGTGDERGEALRVAGVHVAPQAQRADRCDDRPRVLRLDRDRPRGVPVRHHVRDLGGAPADRVAAATLVDGDGAHGTSPRHELGDELVEGVGLPGELRGRKAERLEDRQYVGRRQGEAGLHDWPPAFEALGVEIHQDLDVHEAVADLDAVAGPGQQVQLVAIQDAGRRQRRQVVLGGPEPGPEGAPLPARDDRGHRLTP